MGGKYTVDACAKSYSQRHHQTAEHPATQLWILIMYIHTRSLFHNLSLSFKNTENKTTKTTTTTLRRTDWKSTPR